MPSDWNDKVGKMKMNWTVIVWIIVTLITALLLINKMGEVIQL